MGGLFADRRDKQRILLVTQTLSGLLAGVFPILIATGSIQLWIVYLLALALGFVNVVDNAARQSFISEMVSAPDLPNAVTLNSVAMNMARVFGAALGGVIAGAIGLALCFGGNALSFVAVLISLLAMRKSELFRPSGWPGRRARSTFNSLAKTTLQLTARREERGRVMALWGLAWLGSTPIGGPIVGLVGQHEGARWGLLIGGMAALICGVVALPALTRSGSPQR